MKNYLKDLEAVLKNLEKAGLKFNLDKCKSTQKEVKVIGHIVS